MHNAQNGDISLPQHPPGYYGVVSLYFAGFKYEYIELIKS